MRGSVRSGLVAEDLDIDRHLAPAEEEQAAALDHLLDDRLRPGLRIRVVVRQENHADAEIASSYR